MKIRKCCFPVLFLALLLVLGFTQALLAAEKVAELKVPGCG
jgi:hypothetical protein